LHGYQAGAAFWLEDQPGEWAETLVLFHIGLPMYYFEFLTLQWLSSKSNCCKKTRRKCIASLWLCLRNHTV
jgi:hypothetical protein